MQARAGPPARSNPVRKVKPAMLNMIPKLLPLLDTAEAATADGAYKLATGFTTMAGASM